MQLSQSGQWCLSGQLIPQQLSSCKQLGLPTPFARLGPQHSVLCMTNRARQDLKLTTLIADMVVNGNMNVLEHAGCPVDPLTWKSLLAKLLFLNIKIIISYPKPILTCSHPFRFSKVCAIAGHLLGGSRPTCHFFSILGCSKQNQEVLGKKQMVREKKSAKDTSVLHNTGHETC